MSTGVGLQKLKTMAASKLIH